MNDLFGALDVTEIPEFPDNGTHEYVLKNVKKLTTSSGANKLVMEFHLDEEESPFNGDKFAKWFNLSWLDAGVTSVEEFDAKMTRDYNTLKKWFRDLNVPDDEIATISYNELTGTRVLGYGFKREKWDKSGEEYFLANVKVA